MGGIWRDGRGGTKGREGRVVERRGRGGVWDVDVVVETRWRYRSAKCGGDFWWRRGGSQRMAKMRRQGGSESRKHITYVQS